MSQVANQARAYSSFQSMRPLGVFVHPLDEIHHASPLQVTPQH